MKKLILGAVMMIGFISFSTAQTVATPAPKTTKPTAKNATLTKPVTHVTVTPQPVVKKTVVTTTVPAKPVVKPAVTVTAKPATTEGVVLKKDGTPDKRYNKAAVKEGPLKKDGTADKRYKANKKG